MTETPDPFRERAHRLAETFTDDGETTVVALLADAGEPGASWRAAAALAGASAARRRTLLVNLAGAGSGLDGFLEVEGREGLEAVRSGDRKLSEAAVSPPGRDFLYLPAGDPAPGDRARPTEDQGVLRALGRLADKIREARGVLLLYLEAGALPASLAGELVDGAVPLVGADPHLPAGVPELGRLAAPEPPEEPDEGPGPGTDGASEDDFLPGVTREEAADFGVGPAGGGVGEIDLPEPPEPEEPPAAEGSGPEPPDGEGEAYADDELEDAFVQPEPPAGATPEEEPAPETGGGEESPGGTGEEVPEPTGAGPGTPADGEDAAAGGEGDGDEGDGGGWRRHRRSSGPPWARIAAGAAAVLLLGGGWWWFAGRAAEVGGEASAGTPAASGEAGAAADSPAAPAAAAEDRAASSAAPAGDAAAPTPAEGAPPADAVGSAPELTHSVLVASYSSWSDARERAEALRSERGGTWLVAPTPVRGRVYWRLFAGAAPGSEAGRALMEELVRAGVKDSARAWDVRPASLAYRLGVEASRSAAAERAADLRGRGIPAYVLPAAAGADTAWQVYAGAYESREAAARLGEILEEAGVEARLVERRGQGGGR